MSNISWGWKGKREDTWSWCWHMGVSFATVCLTFTHRGTLCQLFSRDELHVQVFALRLPPWFDQPLENLRGNAYTIEEKKKGKCLQLWNEYQLQRLAARQTSHARASFINISSRTIYNRSLNITAAAFVFGRGDYIPQEIQPAQAMTRLPLLLYVQTPECNGHALCSLTARMGPLIFHSEI